MLSYYEGLQQYRVKTGHGSQALAADFDSDAKADPVVAQVSTGHWKLKLSSVGYSLVDLPGFLGE